MGKAYVQQWTSFGWNNQDNFINSAIFRVRLAPFLKSILKIPTINFTESKKITVERIFSGHFKTSLEMQGFQICLLNLPKDKGDLWLELMDAPTGGSAWTGGELSVRSEGQHVDDDTLLQADGRKVRKI